MFRERVRASKEKNCVSEAKDSIYAPSIINNVCVWGGVHLASWGVSDLQAETEPHLSPQSRTSWMSVCTSQVGILLQGHPIHPTHKAPSSPPPMWARM